MRTILYDEVGPIGLRKVVLTGRIIALVVLAALCYVGYLLAQRGQLDGALWAVLLDPDFHGLLITGLIATLKVAIFAMLFSMLAGVFMAAGLMSSCAWLRIPLRVWMEVFRGLPLLLVIYFIYLGAPSFGVEISSFWSLVVGLTLYNSSMLSEIFRAGIVSLPKGQKEAAYAIGLREGQVLRIILLPQAVRRMLPLLVSQLVIILKETSLGFIIGYTELLREGRTAVEYLGGQYSIPVYFTMAVVYVAINMILSFIARRLDNPSGK